MNDEVKERQASADLHASIDLVQGQLIEFDKIAAGLAALEQAHPKDVACNVSTVAGMKQAIAGRAAWRDPRVALEKVRKAAKAPVLALGRDIDAFARSLEVKLLEGETHYDEQIKAEEARKEAERVEKIRKEAERVARIRWQIGSDFIGVPAMMDGGTAAELNDEIVRVVAIEIGAVYQELAPEAENAKAAALATLRKMHAKAAEREAEEARLAAEREELAKQRAEQARIATEAKRVRDEEEARLRKDREALAAEQAAARAKQQRLDDEARARRQSEEDAARAAREKADREDRARRDEEDRLAREARAAEDKRIAAERAVLESQQRAAREAEEKKAAAARKAEQERLDKAAKKEREAAAAEQRRLDQEAADRRAAEEAAHAADQLVRAAAHELLEALLMVKAAAEDMRGEDFNLTTEQWAKFHAAIAKATGSPL